MRLITIVLLLEKIVLVKGINIVMFIYFMSLETLSLNISNMAFKYIL